MKYNLNHVVRSSSPAVIVWHSDPVDSRGTVQVVWCHEDWFWASKNGRWMLENQRVADDPTFNSYRMRPTPHDDGSYNDVYIL